MTNSNTEATFAKSIEKMGTSLDCIISPITPVHIGSGNKLQTNFDFWTDSGRTFIVPQSVYLDYLKDKQIYD